MLKELAALQSCRRNSIGSLSTTSTAVIIVRTSLTLPTASTPQVLYCEATTALQIIQYGNRSRKNLLSSPGQKLSRCSPPTRKTFLIAPLQASVRPLSHLLHPTCPCLQAHPLCQCITSNIHTPNWTGSSPGQLTQCLIRLHLTSLLDTFIILRRAAQCTIKVLFKTSVWRRF